MEVLFSIPQAPYQTPSSVVHSPPWPSGHPGGGSHLSISHCSPGQLFWSNVHPGRHLWWRQMLLHKPASSQCGFYNIKQTAFLFQCNVSLQRKPYCTGTKCDTAWVVGLALGVLVCARGCVQLQSSTWHFHSSFTYAICSSPLQSSFRLDHSTVVQVTKFKFIVSLK